MGEVFDLPGGQVPPRARRQAGQADAADADAREAIDGVADGGQHSPHLPVAPLIYGQFDFRRPFALLTFRRAEGADDSHSLGGGRRAVVQGHAARQTAQVVGIGDARDRGAVGLGDVVARVGQSVQELAVIGQENQSIAVGIETAHGAQQGLVLKVHQVGDDARGVDVGAGADDSARLVQGNIIPLFGLDDGAAVERHLVRLRVNLRTQLGHDLAVHPHPPLLNQGLARATRADAGGGEHFL